MVNTTLGSLAELDSAIGPNTPFYVKGELFFGPYGAPFYAFNVGMLFKWIRSQFFQYAGESLTRYTVLATLVVLSGALPVEDSLFVVQFFDFAIFFALIYLTARIVDLALPRRKNSGNIKNLRHARS
jgi:hypothetical protein